MFIDMKARCFMEAAKCLNFTRAAEKLYISQPALSKNIASLEAECSMKLFYRDSRRNRVKLTSAGSVMLCEFQKMEAILDGVIDKARRAESGQEGHLTIGLLCGQIINDITSEVLRNIDEKYPKIEIEKVQGGFGELSKWLEEGSIDTAITLEGEMTQNDGILYEEVQQVSLGFAVQTYHPLAAKRSLRISDLNGQKVIVSEEKEVGGIMEKFRRQCEEAGISVQEVSAPDLMHMHMLAELGKGILITREDSIITRSPNLKFFKSREMGSVRLVAAWRKDNLNPIITLYHRMYEDLYRQQKPGK